MTAVPLVVEVLVMVRGVPSTSLSLASTLMVTLTSSSVLVLSLTAMGGSLTGVMLMVTVATLPVDEPSFAR